MGLAQGFCTLARNSEVIYKATTHWSPGVDRGILWNDSDLAIDWPVDPRKAVLSPKDRNQPRLADTDTYFRYANC